MPNPVVVNASPIIVLAKTGYLDLIRLMGQHVWVPLPVKQEVLQAGPNDPSVQALSQTPWLIEVDPGPTHAAD